MNTTISERLQKIKGNLPKDVTLVAVSKTKSIDEIKQAYDSGQRVFGENKVQEMASKYEALPKDIQWHMIGHLQRNKVKYMAHFVSLIHGVDNFKTLIEVNKQAKKHDRIINCLLQIKIAEEDTKFGFSFDQAEQILNSKELSALENVKILGFMAMATLTEDDKQIEMEFSSLKTFFDSQRKTNSKNCKPTVLSMGMSGDYKIAVKNGSNMVRIGSSIFGQRN